MAAFASPLGAQDDGPAKFTIGARLVVLHATVVDRKGNLVTDLPQKAFRVFEDGVEQPLKVFKREDAPVSMGIIVDNSGSMRDKRKKVEDAAMALVSASNPQDEVFVVNFSDESYLDVDFTNNMKKLEEGVARIDSRGGTAMRDAIDISMDHLKKKAKRDKKVLVVVTDGNDNASQITLEKLIQKAQQREVLIYTIGLLEEEERRDAKKARHALNAITTATGAQAFYPDKLADVGKFTLAVAHDIRNQYTLAYSPLKQEMDGSYRQIKVLVNASNKPTVRTRTGYYATEEGAKTSAQNAPPPAQP